MKTIDEKAKKLDDIINQLKKLEIANSNQSSDLEILKEQKNQLEIEMQELQDKYNSLEQENQILKGKFDRFKEKEVSEQKKEKEFSEKIDELNQETDSLMNEIEKWQM